MFKKNRSHSSSLSSRRVPEGVSPFSSQGLPEQEPHTKHLRCDGFSFSLLSRVLVGEGKGTGDARARAGKRGTLCRCGKCQWRWGKEGNRGCVSTSREKERGTVVHCCGLHHSVYFSFWNCSGRFAFGFSVLRVHLVIYMFLSIGFGAQTWCLQVGK